MSCGTNRLTPRRAFTEYGEIGRTGLVAADGRDKGAAWKAEGKAGSSSILAQKERMGGSFSPLHPISCNNPTPPDPVDHFLGTSIVVVVLGIRWLALPIKRLNGVGRISACHNGSMTGLLIPVVGRRGKLRGGGGFGQVCGGQLSFHCCCGWVALRAKLDQSKSRKGGQELFTVLPVF
jgi:hypothetical protein